MMRLATKSSRQRKTFTFHCRVCGQQHELHAPASIRPLARRFLGQCLPFATCPEESCVNHGVNVFENYGKIGGARKGLYRNIGSSPCAVPDVPHQALRSDTP